MTFLALFCCLLLATSIASFCCYLVLIPAQVPVEQPPNRFGSNCSADSQVLLLSFIFTPHHMASNLEVVPLACCLFCHSGFKRLSCHLPHYKQRQGRDYTAYLSKKTLYNRAKTGKTGSSKRPCPKCKKLFVRLDNHLRNNPFCKDFTEKQEAEMLECSTTTTTIDASGTEHSAVPSVPTMLESPNKQVQDALPPILLPSSDEDWHSDDLFFSKELIPRVTRQSIVNGKNDTLADRIYTYFANTFGTRE